MRTRNVIAPVACALVAVLATGAPTAAQSPGPSTPDSSRTPASDTLGRVVQLPEFVVSTTRPGDHAPIVRSTLRRADLDERNLGNDTPMLLGTLPGAYAYSDAGNGIGYSYLSIRGFPQRRISVLVNGVPLNDPQSHEVYWIDHPDLLASTEEVQVQRGVGSALYGAASVGGSVHLEVPAFSDTRRASVRIGYGSFETKRAAVEMNSGRLAGGWNLYGRYSRIESFGYRDQSWSKLWSYTLGARHVSEHQTWRVNLYGGPEETHLAYLGVPPDYLNGAVTGDRERDRRFNPLTYRNERDHFFEPHYELIHGWSPHDRLTVSQTLFWFDGKGYYDEQRFGRSLAEFRLAPWATSDSTLFPRGYYRDTDNDGALDRDAQGRAIVERADIVRRRTVANRNYGWIPRVRIEHASGALTLGGELRGADGRHWGELISGNGLPPGTPPNHVFYDYHPRTFTGGLFAREEWRVQPELLATADLAWRHQGYAMRGDRFDGVRFDQPYGFATPRLGVTWTPDPRFEAFASWAHTSREPAFRDLYDAESPGSLPLYGHLDVAAGIYEAPLILPEHVNDLELNGAWRAGGASVSATLFRMSFRDELVYAGQFNTDLGYPILGNAARSRHEGVELQTRLARMLPAESRLVIDGNVSFSNHRFVLFSEVYGTAPGDTVRYDGNKLAFFPSVLGNLSTRWTWKGLTLGGTVQHVGRIYLDNTERRVASIAPRTVLDLTAGARLGLGPLPLEIRAHVFNVLDREYEAGGYMDYDASGSLAPFRIPAAGRNVLVELRLDFE